MGVALMTALLVSVFLLVIGLAFLTFIERDVRFASRQDRQAQAYYLALSGFRYYERRCGSFLANPQQTEAVPPGDTRRFFEVTYDPVGRTVTSRGYIVNSVGQVIGQRILVAPGGNIGEFYDQGQ